MLSIILYGRNDNHGYNLHKRASISLNCLAEILQDEEDEIVFVDWNTPVNLPTFPEAISDTLTDKLKHHLKIVRVRPDIHSKLAKNLTKKPTIEPVARNTALIRTNPKNRWILSTNTDVILLLNKDINLINYLRTLTDGLYEAPRYSVPDGIWETFDRKNPNLIFERLNFFKTNIDLDEIVSTGIIQQYDAPGDFQLIPRNDLINVGGFDEEMKKGWGVDSNLCKRMFLYYGETKIISENIRVYHCEHTRFLTHFTGSDEHNDSNKFYYHVNNPRLTKQVNFGLENIDLEIIKLDTNTTKKISSLIDNSNPPSISRKPVYTQKSGSLVSYPSDHALPYVLDIFEGAREEDSVIYFGDYQKMKNKLAKSLKAWKNLNLQTCKIESGGMASDLFTFKFSDENFKYLIFDYGADLNENIDISNYTHSDDNYLNFFKRNQLHNAAIDLINYILLSKVDISKIFFIFLNAETYGHGTGNRLRDFIPIQQVAINSRVRFGQLSSDLLDLDIKTLNEMINKSKYEIDSFINFNEKKPPQYLNSHTFFQLFNQSVENFAFTEIGTFLDRKSKISLDELFKFANEIIFELDYPNLAGTKLDKINVEIFNQSKSLHKFLNFSGLEGETNYIKLKKSDFPENSKLLFFQLHELSEKIDFDGDRIYKIRITNLCLNNNKTSFHWYSLKKLPKVELLKKGWSFSNEPLGRWVINDNFQFFNQKFKIKKSGFIILNASDYANSNLQIKFNSKVNSDYFKKFKLYKIHNIIYFTKVHYEEFYDLMIEIDSENFAKLEESNDLRLRYIQISDLIFARKFLYFYLLILSIKNFLFSLNHKFKLNKNFNILVAIFINRNIKKLNRKIKVFNFNLKVKDFNKYSKYKSYLE